MQPLGYYGLILDPITDIAIDNLHLPELTDLLNDMTNSLNDRHYIDSEEAPLIIDKPITPDDLSDAGKIALIRGLCDRIEIKLMEIAT